MNRRVDLLDLVRIALGSIVAFTGIAKLLSDHEATMALPAWAHTGVAALEVGLALALFSGRVLGPSLALAALCAAGLIVDWLLPGRNCGCVGTWIRMSASQHLVLACVVGTLAGLLIALAPARSTLRKRTSPS